LAGRKLLKKNAASHAAGRTGTAGTASTSDAVVQHDTLSTSFWSRGHIAITLKPHQQLRGLKGNQEKKNVWKIEFLAASWATDFFFEKTKNAEFPGFEKNALKYQNVS